MQVNNAPKSIFAIGRLDAKGAVSEILGTSFLLPELGLFATCSHVINKNDQNLVLIRQNDFHTMDHFQEPLPERANTFPVTVKAIDPINDLCILQSDHPALRRTDSYDLVDASDVSVGQDIDLFGFPLALKGRLVLTYQKSHVSAKMMTKSQFSQTKNLVINLQSTPGQSGSPVYFTENGRVKLAGVLRGAYNSNGDKQGISLSGIDPETLHPITHVISAEYLKPLLK